MEFHVRQRERNLPARRQQKKGARRTPLGQTHPMSMVDRGILESDIQGRYRIKPIPRKKKGQMDRARTAKNLEENSVPIPGESTPNPAGGVPAEGASAAPWSRAKVNRSLPTTSITNNCSRVRRAGRFHITTPIQTPSNKSGSRSWLRIAVIGRNPKATLLRAAIGLRFAGLLQGRCCRCARGRHQHVADLCG